MINTAVIHPLVHNQIHSVIYYKCFIYLISHPTYYVIIKDGNALFNDAFNTFYLWLHDVGPIHYLLFTIILNTKYFIRNYPVIN